MPSLRDIFLSRRNISQFHDKYGKILETIHCDDIAILAVEFFDVIVAAKFDFSRLYDVDETIRELNREFAIYLAEREYPQMHDGFHSERRPAYSPSCAAQKRVCVTPEIVRGHFPFVSTTEARRLGQSRRATPQLEQIHHYPKSHLGVLLAGKDCEILANEEATRPSDYGCATPRDIFEAQFALANPGGEDAAILAARKCPGVYDDIPTFRPGYTEQGRKYFLPFHAPSRSHAAIIAGANRYEWGECDSRIGQRGGFKYAPASNFAV
ncbi:MAG: hypothetical protein M0R33_13900 [Methylomonas sp.]|jgi:hypothetical protein|uniref:hypothetical protein n=1 Tax=Methylomonas sp. TaxID=418 RepID=UPI0025FA1BC1|nr:hypothetical protein [Methylomonas sp.]MCK9607529.1 hypothetical protein [Methylomonas sp.]